MYYIAKTKIELAKLLPKKQRIYLRKEEFPYSYEDLAKAAGIGRHSSMKWLAIVGIPRPYHWRTYEELKYLIDAHDNLVESNLLMIRDIHIEEKQKMRDMRKVREAKKAAKKQLKNRQW